MNLSGLYGSAWEVFGEKKPGSAGADCEDRGGAGVAGEEVQRVATTELHEWPVFDELAAEEFEMECCDLVSALPEDGDQLSVGEDLGIRPTSGVREHFHVVTHGVDAAIRVELTVHHDFGEGFFSVEEEQASLDDGGMGFGAACAKEGYESIVVSGSSDYDGGVSGADRGADGLAEALEEGGVIFIKDEGVAAGRSGSLGRIVIAGRSCDCAHVAIRPGNIVLTDDHFR
jgi:hypothetical protein